MVENFVIFKMRSQKFEKRILASSCLSICPSLYQSEWNNLALTERIFMTFDILGFFENVSRKFIFH